jgi:hypothetical protein
MRMTASWFRSHGSTEYKVVARSPRLMASSPRNCRRCPHCRRARPINVACRCARDRQGQVASRWPATPLTVTARGGQSKSGRDEEMVASWSNKEMETIENQLDSYRPIQGFRMPASRKVASSAEGRRPKAFREDAMGGVELGDRSHQGCTGITPAEHPHVQAERPQPILFAL